MKVSVGDKMKTLKKYRYHILSFFLPLFLLLLFFLWKGCFTDKNILNSDMHAQYVPLFQHLKNVLHGTATFPYTFSKGLGGAMVGAFFYYLANPLNLFVYFFDNIPFFLMILVLLKISLSGFTMFLFLQKKFGKPTKTLLLFSCAYALMNYNINYYVNLMWLDGVILAPLLFLAIDRILDKKGDFPYIFTLFLAIFLNYYIGYIVTIGSVLYFFYEMICRYGKAIWKERKMIFQFLLITILTGLMTSFILLPCALELIHTMRVQSWGDIEWINPNFLDFVAPLTIGFGNLNNPLNFFGFCVFCGTCMIPLVLSYFTNKKIPKREKLATLGMYLCFLLPILFPILNMIWHMFTIPMAFNYRYSFLTTLFTLMISYRSLNMLEPSKKVLRFSYFLIAILLCSLGYVTIFTPEYYVFLTIYKVIATFLLLSFSFLLVWKKKTHLLKGMLVFEIIVNFVWIGLDSNMEKQSLYEESKEELTYFAKVGKDAFRSEKEDIFGSNDSFLGNYSGVSVFLTTASGKPISFLSKASNYSEKRNFYYYHPDMILDMLLGVEYVGNQYPIPGYELLEERVLDADKEARYFLMKNPYALSIGYMVPSTLKEYTSSKEGFFFLEELLNEMTGRDEDYLLSLPIEKVDDLHYELTLNEEYPYIYLYVDGEPMIEGKEIEDYLWVADDFGVMASKVGKISFSFEEAPQSFQVYTIDVSAIQEFWETREQFVLSKNTGNHISGTITASQDGYLFFSIPYEEGWEASLDGKKVPCQSLLDTFLAIEVKQGTHTVELNYHVPGIKAGIFLSLGSFLLLLGYERYRKRHC